MAEKKEIEQRKPNVDFFFKLTRKDDRVILSINLSPLGYWTAEDFSSIEYFERRFMAREFTELILPRLTYEPEMFDRGFIEKAEMARQSALAECIVWAENRAKVWKSAADKAEDEGKAVADYLAKMEEAQAIANTIRILLDRPERQGRLNP